MLQKPVISPINYSTYLKISELWLVKIFMNIETYRPFIYDNDVKSIV